MQQMILWLSESIYQSANDSVSHCAAALWSAPAVTAPRVCVVLIGVLLCVTPLALSHTAKYMHKTLDTLKD